MSKLVSIPDYLSAAKHGFHSKFYTLMLNITITNLQL